MFPTPGKPDRFSPLPPNEGPIPGRPGSRASDLLFGDGGSLEKLKQRPKQAGESEFVPPIPPLKPTVTDLPVDQWGLHRVVSTTHIRGLDPQGAGYFGAPRGNHVHKGLDVAVTPGAAIFSPLTGILSIGDAYKKGAPHHGESTRLTVMDSSGHVVNIMYASPATGLVEGSRVSAGELIGYADDMHTHYGPGLTNHVHLETYVVRGETRNYFDPTPWVRSWSRKPTEGDR